MSCFAFVGSALALEAGTNEDSNGCFQATSPAGLDRQHSARLGVKLFEKPVVLLWDDSRQVLVYIN